MGLARHCGSASAPGWGSSGPRAAIGGRREEAAADPARRGRRRGARRHRRVVPGHDLGDLGGRMDPENVWAWSAIFGAAAGLLLALAGFAVVRWLRGSKEAG